MKFSYLKEREKSIHESKQSYRLADTWDRLAAAVVDLIIVAIIANVMTAPFRKNIQEGLLLEADGLVTYNILLCFMTVFGVFVFYHTISLFFFKKTVGKKIFKIEIAHILPYQRLHLWPLFFRSVCLFFSILFLFIPLLEIFSNPLRRPIHDRVTDTYVKGLAKQMAPPNFNENIWVKFIFFLVAIHVSFILGALFYFERPVDSFLADVLIPEEYLCDEVTEAQSDFEDDNMSGTRLDAALMLYSADMISKDCLEMEAQRALQFGEDLDKAYLAIAFVYEDQFDLSNNYLEQVCIKNPKGEPCFVSNVIDSWNKREWSKATDLFKKSSYTRSFSNIWAIKHFSKMRDHIQVLNFSDKLFPTRSVSQFLMTQRSLAWAEMYPNEKQPLYQSAYETLDNESRFDFAVSSCYNDLALGCTNKSEACRKLVEKEEVPLTLNDDEHVVITYIKAAQCGYSNLDEIISDFRNRTDEPSLQLFMAASKAETINKSDVSKQIYKSILKNSDQMSEVFYETQLKLLNLASSDDDFKEIISWWRDNEKKSPFHLSFSRNLLRELIKEKKWNQAYVVALDLYKKDYAKSYMNQELAYIFLKNNKMNLAKDFFKTETNIRKPASSADIEVESLELFFGNEGAK